MAVSRDDLSYGTLDGHTVVVTDERGPDVRDVMHPTAAMLAQVDVVRAAAQASHDADGTLSPLAFLVLALSDALLATEEILTRFVDGDPDAYRLAETWVALGWDGVSADRTVECLRLNLTGTLDLIDASLDPDLPAPLSEGPHA